MIVSDSGGGKDFVQPPAGNHVARCYSIVDMGTQAGEWKGKATVLPKVQIRWELCNEMMEDGRPFSVMRIFTAMLGETAALREVLESWRGKKFTKEELAGFNISKLLGAPCLVNVTLSDKNKAKVSAVSPVPKGMEVPPQVNKSVQFDMAHYDEEVFQSLSDWLKGEIMKSPEYTKATGKFETGSMADLESDIPF
jgi:hypothetical protein